MEYFVASGGITGKGSTHNGDGLVMKHGEFTEKGEDKDILFAVVIKDMSDEDKRGILSAAYVRSFDRWYENEISRIAETKDFSIVRRHWKTIFKNAKIITDNLNMEEGGGYRAVVSALLMVDSEYIYACTGDLPFGFAGDKYNLIRTYQKGSGKVKAGGKYTREPSFREGKVEEGMYVLSTSPFFMPVNEELLIDLAATFGEPEKESVEAVYMCLEEYMDKENDSVTVIARPVR